VEVPGEGSRWVFQVGIPGAGSRWGVLVGVPGEGFQLGVPRKGLVIVSDSRRGLQEKV